MVIKLEIGTTLAINKSLTTCMKKATKLVDNLSDRQITRLGKMYLKTTNYNPEAKYLLMYALLTLVETLGGTSNNICENCGALIEETLTKCPKCNTYFSIVTTENKTNEKKKAKLRTT